MHQVISYNGVHNFKTMVKKYGLAREITPQAPFMTPSDLCLSCT